MVNDSLDIADSLATHRLAIDQNAGDIATNAGFISTNATDISTNQTAISDNATNLLDVETRFEADSANNADSLIAIRSDLNGLNIVNYDPRITADSTRLEDLRAKLVNDSLDIADSLATHRLAIDQNAGDIATNAGFISTNATDISTNQTAISDNATDILDVETRFEADSANNADSLIAIRSDLNALTFTDDDDWSDNASNTTVVETSKNTSVGSSNTFTNFSQNAFSAGSGIDNQGTNTIGLGSVITVVGDNSSNIGFRNSSTGSRAHTIGSWITSTGSDAITIGGGASAGVLLSNGLDSTIMLGYRSNLPTLTIRPAEGSGTVGEVGIGTTTPDSLLTVAGGIHAEYIRLRGGAQSGYVLGSDANGNATWQDPNTLVSGDNLGDHTATSNLQLNGNYISNDGDNEGIKIDNSGFMGLGTNPNTNARVAINETSVGQGLYVIQEDNSSTRAAIKGEARGANGTEIYALEGEATSSGTNNYGLHAIATGSGSTNYGVFGKALGGTTNWAGYFDQGDVFITDTLRLNKPFTLSSGATDGYVLSTNANGVATWADPNTLISGDGNGIYDGSGSLGGNTTVTQGANTLAFTTTATNGFSVDGTTFSVDAANNRVGIGTTTPTSDLHVLNSDIVKSTVESTAGDAASLTLKTPAKEWEIQNNSLAGGYLQFIDVTSGNTRFTISPDGRVGIGTTVPSQSLFQVVGGVRVDSLIIDGEYHLPTTDGTANQVMKTDGSGNLTFVDASTLISGDNLGNHTATNNIQLGNNYISNDGDSEGISIDPAGEVSFLSTTGNSLTIAKGGGGESSLMEFLSYGSGNTAGTIFDLYNARGNSTTKTAVQDGDRLFTIKSRAFYDPTNIVNNELMTMSVDGTVSTNIVPTRTDFQTVASDGLSNTVLTLRSDGTVGIGETNPDSTLTVNGGIKTTFFTMTDGATNNYVLASDANGVATWTDPSTLVSGDNLGNHTATTNIKLDGNYLSNDGDNEGIHIATNGNVTVGSDKGFNQFGVWQESGATELSIFSEVSSSTLEMGASGSSGESNTISAFRFRGDWPSFSSVVAGDDIFKIEVAPHNGTGSLLTDAMNITVDGVSGGNIATRIDFSTVDLSGSNSTLLSIEGTSGNVGIGTTSPDSALSVNGGIRADAIRLTDGASTGRVLTALDANGNAAWEDASSLSPWTTNTDTLYNLTKYIGVGVTNPAAKMSIYNDVTAAGFEVVTERNTNDNLIGLFGGATGTGNGQKYGGYFSSEASGGSQNVGAYAIVNNSTSTSTNIGFWGDGRSQSGTEARGLMGEASGAGQNIGIYARATGGTANWAGYFESGRVYIQDSLGIGTNVPSFPFHLSGSGNTTARIDAGSNNRAALQFAEVTGAFGSSATGFELAYDGSDDKFQIRSANGGTIDTMMTFSRLDGYVGIQNNSPLATFDVGGAIKVDAAIATPVAGMIQWSGSDFQGYDGSTWQSLTSSNSTCPAGMTNAGGNLCIETGERTASNWFDAASTCVAAGYKLPNWAEWYGAMTNASLTDETDDWEWVSDGTSNTARKVGNSGLKNTANDDPDTGSEAFRCVYYLK